MSKKKETTEKQPAGYRFLRVLLPLLALAVIIFFSRRTEIADISADTSAVYARATVTEVLEDNSGGEAFFGSQRVTATITGGRFKGMNCELENTNSYQRGAFCQEGTKIIVLVAENDDGTITGSVYNYDRTGMIYMLLILFAVILVAVGGKKGAASLYALAFTAICVICMYIPLLYAGISGILAALFTAVTILIASIYILNGWSAKSACAILGTTVGVAVSGLLAMAVGRISGLSGYNMSDVESMVYIANSTPLDVAGVLYAGILISSLGAVMDVSISLVSAMYEVNEKAPKLKMKALFLSGMNVGRDMMGTMSNTLILAYAGSATGVMLTVYSYQMPYLQIMGYNSIVIEIVCGLCGTIGVILTVPLQAAITARLLKSEFFHRFFFVR